MAKKEKQTARQKELSDLADKRAKDLVGLNPRLSQEDSEKVQQINSEYRANEAKIIKKHNDIENEKLEKAEKAAENKVITDEKKADAEAKAKQEENARKNKEAQEIAEKELAEKKAKENL